MLMYYQNTNFRRISSLLRRPKFSNFPGEVCIWTLQVCSRLRIRFNQKICKKLYDLVAISSIHV